jgi:hypothetical protein
MELPRDLITIKKAARLANNCNQAVIRRWVFKGRIQGYRVGPAHVLLVSRADVMAMIQAVPTNPTGVNR